MKFKEKLEKIDACQEAINWVKTKGFKKSRETCERGDWMLWYVFRHKKQLGLEDMRLITLAKAKCAGLVKHLMKDKRSLNALKVAERFGVNQATKEDLSAAADAAAVAAVAADPNAYAYAAAAYAAAYAAYTDATYAAVAAAYAAYAADAYADAARKETLSKCADICREVFKDVKS